ncbi:MAG TPA: heavy metal-binding domain-containing protein [Aggregicoccus sp.]|nr:heavy metal-binding domain-containing protein [Aggregicoccus sp.]
MLRSLGVLGSVLALVSCAGGRQPPPAQLDPSNPDAPEAAPSAASTTLAPEAPPVEEPAEQPPAGAGGHEGHARHETEAGRAAPDAGSALYACPMHPEVTDTKPSRCPKCGMTLVLQKAEGKPRARPPPKPDAGHGAAPAAQQPKAVQGADAGVTLYACPMHPEVTDTRPSRCPKCGMTLVPQKAPATGHEGHGGADGGR